MENHELIRRLLNLVRKGTVLEVRGAQCRVSCGELQTNWIPWTALAAGETADWDPPTTGEQVVLLSPGGDPADAVAIRGLYSTEYPAPSTTPSAHVRQYADGARVSYDHAGHELVATLPAGAVVRIEAPGAVTIKTATARIEADTITLDAGSTHCTGSLQVDQDIGAGGTVTGAEVKAGDITLTGHAHMERGDGKRVGPPLP